VTLSAADELPVHQTAEVIRHVATSDRNFYDRYYFCAFPTDGTAMVVLGMGVYPNLGVHDAFACVHAKGRQSVVRASRPLVDRTDLTVGPIRVEVLEPLRRLRFTCDGADHGLAVDLTWTGAGPAFEEERHQWRSHGRLMIDTMRFAQTGRWEGWVEVGGERLTAEPDTWWGTRDRSWGVRPLGEDEPAGIHGLGLVAEGFMWNYAPMQFADHTLLYMCQERSNGDRDLQSAVKVWHDPTKARERLGRPEHHHRLDPGTRHATTSTLAFPEAPGGGFEVAVETLHPAFLQVGTGYGRDPSWRHGMYQGPELVVQGVERADDDIDGIERFLVDSAARFTYTDPATGAAHEGYGLHEWGFFGPFPRYGLRDLLDGASDPLDGAVAEDG
jgi:hypothetical protein